jgi:hypothetical protein
LVKSVELVSICTEAGKQFISKYFPNQEIEKLENHKRSIRNYRFDLIDFQISGAALETYKI